MIFAASQHGSKTFAQRDGISLGKDGMVAPHGGSERQRRGRRKRFPDGDEIVASVEDAAVVGANGLRTVGGIVLAATGAFEMRQHDEAEFSRGTQALDVGRQTSDIPR